jgi:hypothetical protein
MQTDLLNVLQIISGAVNAMGAGRDLERILLALPIPLVP